MIELNLFGEKFVEVFKQKQAPKKGYVQLFKSKNYYHVSDNKDIRCKTCKNILKMEYHSKIYYKCKHLGTSNSERTDIRLKCVCNLYEDDE